MKIEVSNPEIYFAVFYVLAFAIMILSVVAVSLRHKIPLMPVLLIIATVTLFTIIGSRISSMDPGQIMTITGTGSASHYGSRSVAGGLIAGMLGLLISGRILGAGLAVINVYSWMVPLGFGIQQIGCFFNGCCFGNPATIPWGVSYPFGTCAHHSHWANRLIGETDAWSLAVHPVQLYESVCLIVLASLSFRLQKRWRKKGSCLIFPVSFYLVIKFASDFFRHTETMAGGRTYAGVSTLQWICLASGVAGLCILLANERYSSHLAADFRNPESPATGKSLAYILALSALLYLFRGSFSWYEMLSSDLIFVPVIILAGWAILRSFAVITVKFAASSFMAVPLSFLLLAFPQDTVKQKESVRSFYDSVKSFSVIDAGGSFGNHFSLLEYNPQEGECGTYYTTEDYKYEFKLGGFGYAKVRKDEKQRTTLGLRMFIGQNVETNMTYNTEKKYTLFGIYPYLKYDIPWIGFGAGLYVGNLRWVPNRPSDQREVESGTKMFPLMPALELRVGRKDLVDLKYCFVSDIPASFPVLASEFSLGSGFGLKPDYSLRYGLGWANNRAYQFVSAEALLGKKIGLVMKYNFKNEVYFIDTYHSGKWFQLVLNYRFDFEK